MVAFLADNGLFGSADGSIVKGLAGHDGLHRMAYIRGSLNVSRGVAGPHPNGRFTRAVCSLYHSRAAGSNDDGYFPAMHQLIGCTHGGHGDTSNHIFRRPCFHGCLAHQLGCL